MTTSTPRRYELTLTVRTAHEKGIEANTDAAATAVGQLTLDPLTRMTIEVFEDLLRRDRIERNEELVVLGSYLYKALFTGAVEKLFLEELKAARDAQKRLRLQLTFTGEQEHLIHLPWEFLYSSDPQMGDFLATRVDLVLSRYMPIPGGRTTLAPDVGPLKVLIAVSRAQGPGLGDIIAKPVIQAIEQLGQEEQTRPKQAGVLVRVLEQPNTTNLQAELTDFKPHIFHFIGHGRFENKKAEIALTQVGSPAVFWCDDAMLLKCFQRAQAFPRLVFLQMCEGGEIGYNQLALTSFTGFAPRLLSAQIPAVVAMKYIISNQDAIKLSKMFYQALAQGKGVDEAIQLGRDQIGFEHGYRNRVFGTPILFLHSYDGIIRPLPTLPADANATPLGNKPEETTTPEGQQPGGMMPLGAEAALTVASGVGAAPPTGVAGASLQTAPTLIDAIIAAGKKRLQELKLNPLDNLQILKRLTEVKQALHNVPADEVPTQLLNLARHENPQSTPGAAMLQILEAMGLVALEWS